MQADHRGRDLWPKRVNFRQPAFGKNSLADIVQRCPARRLVSLDHAGASYDSSTQQRLCCGRLSRPLWIRPGARLPSQRHGPSCRDGVRELRRFSGPAERAITRRDLGPVAKKPTPGRDHLHGFATAALVPGNGFQIAQILDQRLTIPRMSVQRGSDLRCDEGRHAVPKFNWCLRDARQAAYSVDCGRSSVGRFGRLGIHTG